jgi:chromosome partitioning protein
MFETAIVERAAFKDLFDFGGTLAGLAAAQTGNLEKAIQNAREFAGEVVSKLKAAANERSAA